MCNVESEAKDAYSVGHAKLVVAAVVAGVGEREGRLPPIYSSSPMARGNASLPHKDAQEAVIYGAASHGRVMHRGEITPRRHQPRVHFLQYFAYELGAMQAYARGGCWDAVSGNVQRMTHRQLDKSYIVKQL